jgi:hypothetical protein
MFSGKNPPENVEHIRKVNCSAEAPETAEIRRAAATCLTLKTREQDMNWKPVESLTTS